MNLLLKALPDKDRKAVEDVLEPVGLERGATIFNTGAPLDRIYFLDKGIVSLISEFSDGATAEITAVGPEGFVNVGSLLDDDHAIARYTVQAKGKARMGNSKEFRSIVDQRPIVRSLMLRYVQALVGELSQTVACNLLHSLDHRLARWLLLFHDRNGENGLDLTHEYLGQMLGVRRASISEQAAALQRDGAIAYSRGRIEITDRNRLKQHTCECHDLIQGRYRRLLPEIQLPS